MSAGTPDKLYDNFGHEMAANDLERAHGHIDEFFIQTSSIERFLNRDPSQPFIVGPKGSGKSLLLFKKLLMARSLSGVVVLPRPARKAFTPALTFANLAEVSQFWQLWKDGKPKLESWGALWEWALLRTILSGWLFHEKRKSDKSEHYDELVTLTGGSENADPFVLISEYLQQLEGGQHQYKGRVQPPNATALRDFAINYGPDFPATYIFVDNHDDYYEQQPEFWMASCYGAFLAIQSLHLNSNRRIHCFLTIRPEVVWELQKSQHFPMWSTDIFRIEWEDHNLIELFKLRASKLRPDLLQEPGLAPKDPLAALLGSALLGPDRERVIIRDVRVELDQPLYEPVEGYLLRHTLRRPRDLIIVGNQIVARANPHQISSASEPNRIREAIEHASRIIGSGYVAEIKRQWPWGAEGPRSLESFLTRFIRHNVIPREEAHRIQAEFAAELGLDPHEVHPLTELVKLGLLGYPVQHPNKRDLIQKFVRVGETTISAVPVSADWYLVHPVLYGDPFHIRAVKGQVIGPDLTFDPSRLEKPATVTPAAPEVEPPAPEAIKPAPRADTESRVFSWIHLSDLHFGAGSISHRFDQKAVMRAIARDLAQNGPRNPDVLFVTGDIAFSAQPSQYEDAKAWLEQIAKAAGVSPERVRMVPGNHDVDRRVAADGVIQDIHRRLRTTPDVLDERLADRTARKLLEKKLTAYRMFTQEFSEAHRELAKQGFDWSEQLPADASQLRRVRIVGLSSVWVSDEIDGRESRERATFVRNMILGPGQIQRMLGQVADDELLFVLTHHPPEWMHPRSAEALARALARPAHIHLCGHVHAADAGMSRRFGATGRSVRYVAGAAHGDPSEETKHGYAWGAVRWNPREQRWEVGWAPRVYVPEHDEMFQMPGPYNDDGFAWEEIDLKWTPPT